MGDMTETTKMDIESFVRSHQDGLRDYLLLLGCNESLADDIAQESFLVFLRRAPLLDGEGAAALYLRRCAFNLLRESHHSEARHQAILRHEAAETIWARFKLDDSPSAYQEALKDCLQGLSSRMSETLSLHYRRGMSGPEVARASGRSESEVWTTLHRARERLRSCINRKLNHDI